MSDEKHGVLTSPHSKKGFTQLVVENPDLIAILDDIYTDAVAEVYDTQITMSPPQT